MQGHAILNKGAATAFFSLPESLKVKLDPKTVFPATLIRTVIDAALRGERFLNLTVFDGSNMEKGVLVSVVIGKPIKPATNQTEAILMKRSWPMSAAFFSPNNQTEIPDYQVEMELNENGISQKIKMNFGDYVVHAELTHIEALPVETSPCRK